MPENLMNSSHKASTEESRENYSITFGHKCEYHGGRRGVLLSDGIWLCAECSKEHRVTLHYTPKKCTAHNADAVIFLHGEWLCEECAEEICPAIHFIENQAKNVKYDLTYTVKSIGLD